MLGHEAVGHLAARHDGRAAPGAAAHRDAPGRSLIGHEQMGQVVHQGGHNDRINWLQVDLDGRLNVVTDRGGSRSRGQVGAHPPRRLQGLPRDG
jgi:hypothetical protein